MSILLSKPTVSQNYPFFYTNYRINILWELNTEVFKNFFLNTHFKPAYSLAVLLTHHLSIQLLLRLGAPPAVCCILI